MWALLLLLIFLLTNNFVIATPTDLPTMAPTVALTWSLVNSQGSKYDARWASASGIDSVGNIYVIGGVLNTGSYYQRFNDVWRSSDDGVTWSSVATGNRFAIRESVCLVIDSEDNLYLIGGEDAGTYYGDVWMSSDSGVTWVSVAQGTLFDARAAYGCLVDADDNLYILGGQYNRGNSAYNDVWKSSNSGVTWTQINSASASFSSRFSYAAVIDSNGYMYAIGGLNSGSLNNDVWRSVDGGVTWVEVDVAGDIFSARYALGGVAANNCIYVIGGVDSSVVYDMWVSCDWGATWKEISFLSSYDGVFNNNNVFVDGDYVYLVSQGSGTSNLYTASIAGLSTPTSELTIAPTSAKPSSQPTSIPSMEPTSKPSRQPTSIPSTKPSNQPTSQPSAEPSNQPSSQPSNQPSSQPSAEPSSQPSSQPSAAPSFIPTSAPTIEPFTLPIIFVHLLIAFGASLCCGVMTGEDFRLLPKRLSRLFNKSSDSSHHHWKHLLTTMPSLVGTHDQDLIDYVVVSFLFDEVYDPAVDFNIAQKLQILHSLAEEVLGLEIHESGYKNNKLNAMTNTLSHEAKCFLLLETYCKDTRCDDNSMSAPLSKRLEVVVAPGIRASYYTVTKYNDRVKSRGLIDAQVKRGIMYSVQSSEQSMGQELWETISVPIKYDPEYVTMQSMFLVRRHGVKTIPVPTTINQLQYFGSLGLTVVYRGREFNAPTTYPEINMNKPLFIVLRLLQKRIFETIKISIVDKRHTPLQCLSELLKKDAARHHQLKKPQLQNVIAEVYLQHHLHVPKTVLNMLLECNHLKHDDNYLRWHRDDCLKHLHHMKEVLRNERFIYLSYPVEQHAFVRHVRDYLTTKGYVVWGWQHKTTLPTDEHNDNDMYLMQCDMMYNELLRECFDKDVAIFIAFASRWYESSADCMAEYNMAKEIFDKNSIYDDSSIHEQKVASTAGKKLITKRVAPVTDSHSSRVIVVKTDPYYSNSKLKPHEVNLANLHYYGRSMSYASKKYEQKDVDWKAHKGLDAEQFYLFNGWLTGKNIDELHRCIDKELLPRIHRVSDMTPADVVKKMLNVYKHV